MLSKMPAKHPRTIVECGRGLSARWAGIVVVYGFAMSASSKLTQYIKSLARVPKLVVLDIGKF
jgi:hypothetical protein